MAGKKAGKPATPPISTLIKERKFVGHLVDGVGVHEAALRAGYKSGIIGSNLLHKPRVQTALQLAMEKAGITETFKAKKMREGLDATTPEKKSTEGNVLVKKSPDFFTRAIYLDKALKVSGDYAPEKHITEERKIVLNINMGMAQGLKESGAITDAEFEELKEADVSQLPGDTNGTDCRERGQGETGDQGDQGRGDETPEGAVHAAGPADEPNLAGGAAGPSPEEGQDDEGQVQAGSDRADGGLDQEPGSITDGGLRETSEPGLVDKSDSGPERRLVLPVPECDPDAGRHHAGTEASLSTHSLEALSFRGTVRAAGSDTPDPDAARVGQELHRDDGVADPEMSEELDDWPERNVDYQ
jgi:hypothetical protein